MSTHTKPKGKSRKFPGPFTPEFQRWARSRASSESCAKNGAKGFKSTLEKHGPDIAFNGARQWRFNNPLNNERLVIGILSRLGIAYEREYRLPSSPYTVDFYLTATRQVIEDDSRIHEVFDVGKRRCCATKKRKLLRERGVKCLTIWDRDQRDVGAAIRKVQRFVGRVA